MANINFSGIGSNIDFGVITDSIIASRSRPITQLASKQGLYKGRSDALKQLNAKLIAFKDAASALTDRTLANGRNTASTSPDIAAASASDSASKGTIKVDVVRLASTLSQASGNFNSAQTAVLAGGATEATFELRKGGESAGTSITINSSNNSLEGLRDAINGANAGVTAAIVDISGDGTQNQLVLNSTDTGASGRVELVETTSTGTLAAVNLRNLNPVSGDFSELNASVKINGLTIARSSNVVSDAVSGVTLTLKNTGSSTVTVGENTSGLKGKIAAFADAFNSIQDIFRNQYKLDDKGRPTGILVGDPAFRALQDGLRVVANTVSTANGGQFKELTEIGITRGSDGKLSIDQTILNDKLSSSLTDVQALFSGKTENETGLANSMSDSVINLSDAVSNAVKGFDASIQSLQKNIETQQSRLDLLRTSLARRFSVVDAAIGQLNGQGDALSSVLKSLQSSNDK